MNLKRKIAHPGWLPDAMEHSASVGRLYLQGSIPGMLQHNLVSGAADRVLRACYRNRWELVWVMIEKALSNDWQRIRAFFWRFWRYRIQHKSEEADIRRILSDTCPHCKERHEMRKLGEDEYQCPGCGGKMDFCELADAQPEDEDES